MGYSGALLFPPSPPFIGTSPHQPRETIAVSRSCFTSFAVGVLAAAVLAIAPVSVTATDAANALACAKADLAMLHKLMDEAEPPVFTSTRLAQASMRVLDARAACRAGKYADGVDLYAQADALAGAASAPVMTGRR